MKNSDRVAVVVAAAAATAVIVGLTLRDRPPAAATAEAGLPAISLPQGQRLQDDWSAEEVFRRAFWRHPRADDRIVDAVRYERSDDDGVNRWAWFIKLHPGPELLRDLRVPEKFSLVPVKRPRPWLPEDLPPPEWYDVRAAASDAEVFQHPNQSLTLIYRPTENILLASDHGQGFARPARQ